MGKNAQNEQTNKFRMIVEKELQESEKKARTECTVNKELKIAIDYRQSSRRYNAEEATVTYCSLVTNKVLYHSYLMRKQENL